jgi:hypothetical protein
LHTERGGERERAREPRPLTLAKSRGFTMMAEMKAAPAAESARSAIPSSWSAAVGGGACDEAEGEAAEPPERSTPEAAAVIQVGSEPLEKPAMALETLVDSG